jgi:hypothetical protein
MKVAHRLPEPCIALLDVGKFPLFFCLLFTLALGVEHVGLAYLQCGTQLGDLFSHTGVNFSHPGGLQAIELGSHIELGGGALIPGDG